MSMRWECLYHLPKIVNKKGKKKVQYCTSEPDFCDWLHKCCGPSKCKCWVDWERSHWHNIWIEWQRVDWHGVVPWLTCQLFSQTCCYCEAIISAFGWSRLTLPTWSQKWKWQNLFNEYMQSDPGKIVTKYQFLLCWTKHGCWPWQLQLFDQGNKKMWYSTIQSQCNWLWCDVVKHD